MNLLIIGGCGFLGSNLAAKGLERGETVTVFDNLSRLGASMNLDWLKNKGLQNFVHGDVRNKNDVERLIQEGCFDAIFHLAGQVAMTTSLENPYKDFEINAMGTLNVLDSVRKYSKNTSVFYSSTNKVYGDLEQYDYEETDKRYICTQYPRGFDETVPLDFKSPYGCSKGSADQYMLDYHHMFGLKTAVFRHSSMYGSRQFASYDQGWIGWFCQKAYEKSIDINCEPFSISGTGKQVRDILHANDMNALYFTALDNIDKVCGQAFNVGGSMAQSLSLLELFDMLEELLKVKLDYAKLPVRASDQKVFVADTSKIHAAIGWEPKVNAYEGIKDMILWIREKE